MKFYNPTPWVIEAMASRKIYKFQPFSTGDVWDMDHAKVLMKGESHAVRLGLVHLEFDDALQNKFKGDFEAFKRDQIKRGLKNAYDYARECWVNERQAEIDVKHHKTGAEADKAIINPEPFEARVNEIKALIDDFGKTVAEPSVEAKIAVPSNGKVSKRVYRRKPVNESAANPH